MVLAHQSGGHACPPGRCPANPLVDAIPRIAHAGRAPRLPAPALSSNRRSCAAPIVTQLNSDPEGEVLLADLTAYADEHDGTPIERPGPISAANLPQRRRPQPRSRRPAKGPYRVCRQRIRTGPSYRVEFRAEHGSEGRVADADLTVSNSDIG
jgi:hypothetical protein